MEVEIARGAFVIGTDSSEIPALLVRYRTDVVELFGSEMPRRNVRIGAYWIDRTEVTKAQFRAFVLSVRAWRKEALPREFHNGQYLQDWVETAFPDGEGRRPVVFVTWPAAQAFCAWTGKRLPTEIEWEVAARGGIADAEFPWGNADSDASSANWAGARLGHSTDVGTYPPNGYGLYDMAGNVWEYVSDPWTPDALPPHGAARAPNPATRYVIRGGSFAGASVNLRVRYRDSHPAGGAGPHVGCRCASSTPPKA